MKPSVEIKETKVAKYPAPIKATVIGGGAEFECVLMESQIENMAKALGMLQTDIVDDTEDDEKLVFGPQSNGEVNEFHLMVKQLQAGSTTLYNYIRMPRAYVKGQPEIVSKTDEERKLKITFGLLAVEESGDFQGYCYAIVEEYPAA